MIDAKKVVVGGLAILGLTIAGYRAYELKKLQKAVEEDQIIEIEPDTSRE